MKINLSKHAGFCDGVRRAYEMVKKIDTSCQPAPIFILGSLVHNEEVIKKISKMGIIKISREDFFNAKPGKIGTLVTNAHGSGPDVFKHASKLGVKIINTTCPKVIKVQRLAQVFFKRGYRIIIVGDKDHKEVRGINEWGGNKAFIISSKKDLKSIPFENSEKIAVLSQTTQNEDFYGEISGAIKKKYPQAKINFTTCHTTHARQSEIKNMAKDNDAMIIIGSPTSANSHRLWEIAKAINPRSYFIESAEEIKKRWLNNVKKIGVTAGASTPRWTIRNVLAALESI